LAEDLREEFRRAGEVIAQATVAPATLAARSAYAAGGLGALSGAVLDTAAIAGKLRDDLPWAWAALEATRAGDLAREALGNHDHLTAADLTELRTVLNAHRDDRAFATLFLQSLGAQGLIDLNARMVLSVPRAPQPDAEYTRLVAEVGALQGTLGNLLALATTDPGQSGQVSQFWITDLTRAGRERLGDQPPRSNLYGYHVLGPLLGQGTYSGDFLSAVGGNMIAFEREHAHPPGSAFWTDAATSPLAPPRLDWTTPLPVPDYDPVTAVLSAAAKDPAAARAFLTADVQEYSEQEIGLLKLMPNSVGLRLNRLDYLLTDRVWTPYPGRTGTSGLDALGHLLTRATTVDPRNPDSRWIVESIAHEITIDEQATEHPFATTDLTTPALRPYLADVFAAHLGSMYEDRPPEAGTDIPRLGHGESTLLMAELGKDPDAYATLHRTIAAQTALLYDYYLHYPMTPDRVSPILETISLSAGDLLGALDHGAALTDIERITATDKSNPHATAAAFDLTTALLDQTITGVGTAAGTATAGPPGTVAATTAVEALTMGAHALLDKLEANLAAPQDSTGTLDSIARTRFTNGANTLHGTLEAAIVRTLPHDVQNRAHVLAPDGNLLPKDQWEDPEAAEKVINKHLTTKDPRTGIKAVLDKTWNLYGQGRDNARNLQSHP
ncbi:MAG: hypothetical protein QG608_2821, partial [Actinomycetota bacterium]|nr:hypothetical protein [Actinomycetota bacterium]